MAVTLIEWAAPTAAERQARIQAAAARPKRFAASVVPPPAALQSHEQFMAAHFPEIAASGSPKTPASNPPTAPVTRPPQRPPWSPPASMVGPAVPPATPSVQVTPLGPAPPAATPEEARRRRLGYPPKPSAPADLTALLNSSRAFFSR